MEVEAKKIVIFSSCMETWGGSEELWGQTAEILALRGFQIHIYKFNIDFTHPKIKKLLDLGCQVTDLDKFQISKVRSIWNRFLPHKIYRTLSVYIRKYLARQLKKINPDLFIVAQGANFDGFNFLGFCDLEKIRYVIISQKAEKSHWANPWEREFIIKCWQDSTRNFFVSQENLVLTQEQFGLKLENSEIVRNPFLTKVEEPLAWNFTKSDKIRLACVSRLFLSDKGQDILLRVLADKKWRERNLEVSFFGQGKDESGLTDFARYLDLKNVIFNGHVNDIVSIWQDHQALILPSRNEGLPLALVEAMLCGRTAIVTDVGGNTEVLEDNVTGFVAKSIDEAGVDEALERAWQRKNEWKEIGNLAAKKIRQLIPSNPPQIFAEKLIAIINERAVTEND